MKTLTVQEASQGLGDWLRRAINGEEIAINQGNCTVLLQPIPNSTDSTDASERNAASAREALRKLQSHSRLTAANVEEYLREVRAERQTDGGRNGR